MVTPNQVVARLADERDFGSEPCRRYGLVGAFPARVHQERAAQNGLSGSRQMSVLTTMSVFVLPTTRILPVFGVVLFMSDNF